MSKDKNNTSKTIAKGIYVRDIILASVLSLAIGTVFGYFASIDVISNARQSVVSDIQMVSKTDERK